MKGFLPHYQLTPVAKGRGYRITPLRKCNGVFFPVQQEQGQTQCTGVFKNKPVNTQHDFSKTKGHFIMHQWVSLVITDLLAVPRNGISIQTAGNRQRRKDKSQNFCRRHFKRLIFKRIPQSRTGRNHSFKACPLFQTVIKRQNAAQTVPVKDQGNSRIPLTRLIEVLTYIAEDRLCRREMSPFSSRKSMTPHIRGPKGHVRLAKGFSHLAITGPVLPDSMNQANHCLRSNSFRLPTPGMNRNSI